MISAVSFTIPNEPFFKEALLGLARIHAEKLEEPDYLTGIDYLQKYVSTLSKYEGEYAMAAQQKIYQYQESAIKKAEEDAEINQLKESETATPSAEEE